MMRFISISGLISYERARKIQHALVEVRAREEIPDTVLFLEHTPVITQGRGLQYTGEQRSRHTPLPKLSPEIEFSESERGGDLTYHGPGQLVVYPIVKLDGKGFGPDHDVAGFLRKLESLFITVLAEKGLKASSRESATGVWVDTAEGARKIASIGIAIRKWITYHGIAINVVNDLKPFHLISPCGFEPEVMVTLKELHPESGGEFWREELEEDLAWELTRGLGKATIQKLDEKELRMALSLG